MDKKLRSDLKSEKIKSKSMPELKNLQKTDNQNSKKKNLPTIKINWEETFDSCIDIIAIISKDFNILKLNKAGLDNLGKTAKEIIGKKCFEVVHGRNSPIENCPCEKTLNTGKSGKGEIEDWGRCFLATASPIYDGKGKIAAFSHTIKDISEIKKMQESLQTANENLEIKIKERTKTLSNLNKTLSMEIEERINIEKLLRKSEKNLENEKNALALKNLALQEIINQIEIDKNKMRDEIRSNIEMTILPILERMKNKNSQHVDLLKHHLESVASSYGIVITAGSSKLTSKEIEICNMIKSSFSNKEMANILNISCSTVEWHRKRIRAKLDIKNKGINLHTYLQEM